METPDTKAGHLTERIMQKVKEKQPSIHTYDYNRTYSAVLEVLTDYFGELENQTEVALSPSEAVKLNQSLKLALESRKADCRGIVIPHQPSIDFNRHPFTQPPIA